MKLQNIPGYISSNGKRFFDCEEGETFCPDCKENLVQEPQNGWLSNLVDSFPNYYAFKKVRCFGCDLEGELSYADINTADGKNLVKRTYSLFLDVSSRERRYRENELKRRAEKKETKEKVKSSKLNSKERRKLSRAKS